MDINDLVYSKNDKGDVMMGGYSVNSIMKHRNSNTNVGQSGGKKQDDFDDMFKDLAVPVGLLYIQETHQFGTQEPIKNENLFVNYKTVDDTLYDKLVNLAAPDTREISSEPNKKVKKTSAKKKKTTTKRKSKNKTKKHKNKK